ncbi:MULTISPECIES: SH3 domain-containing protein [unclassified Saccharibacter]|uniref:SH3 domain-containing protein n=1 Tax=unclassified Saccharibacter TaxID=2648722 RepID=UPI001326C56F|nr:MULTISPECIES: SH3 domain-containing protein [unclassified Saccharibacter]MXV36250.1 hypothetical protein [Saccharibacter sp. EH611]MXV57110.1 hypothetical protein [Saccharibacter sp. EH70]MXV66530.1 hypothetical protein [Saccharibacter sp. EH60]
MKLPIASYCCILPPSVLLMVSVGLMTSAVSAYGQEGVSHKSTHHTHHHGKARHHARHAQHSTEEAGHRHHVSHHKKHDAAKGAAVGAVAGAVSSAAIKEKPIAPPASQAGAAAPSEASADNKGSETGLPLPRFAALRADRVYMRRGPGERYPIDWVYHRREYPVKIEREFGVWRLVEDLDGQKGWVHQVTLRGGRSFVIPGPPSPTGDGTSLPTAQHADPRIVAYVPEQDMLRGQNHDVPLMSSQEANQKVVAVLEPGTVGTIKACPKGSSWCHVTVRGYDGWLERQSLWGVQPGEIIQPD